MKILSTIQRDGGSVIEIPPRKYHFIPNENGDHVCDVEDADHIKKFLAVDCYVIYEPDQQNSTPVVASSPEPEAKDQGFEIVDEFEEDADEEGGEGELGSTDANGEGSANADQSGAATDATDPGTGEGTGESAQDDQNKNDQGAEGATGTGEQNKEQQSDQQEARELTPAQKRAQTIAAKKAEGATGKPASTKPKANPALNKAD